MTTDYEILSDEEISNLSVKIKSELNHLTYNAEFAPMAKSSWNNTRFFKLAGVAATVTAVLAYSLMGNSAVSPAWSETPISVSEANQKEILNSCTSMLPSSATHPTMHLTDFRGTFGDAVLGTEDANTKFLRSWSCYFTYSETQGFKALEVNEQKFISPVYTHTSVFPVAMPFPSKPIYEITVWNGGDVIDGVKIPASQLYLGSFANGAYSVKVSCPDIPIATASISETDNGIFSIWVPSNSPDCAISFLDQNGVKIN